MRQNQERCGHHRERGSPRREENHQPRWIKGVNALLERMVDRVENLLCRGSKVCACEWRESQVGVGERLEASQGEVKQASGAAEAPVLNFIMCMWCARGFIFLE